MMAQTENKLIPAATVLMAREGGAGLEVFMVKRHHQIDFASGALVFPGGKVEAGDGDAAIQERIVGADGLDAAARDLRVAAIREAYEECGILLARPRGGPALVDGDRLGTLEESRRQINEGNLRFGDFLVQEDLELACDALMPFAHWITPRMMPKRFDTHFFLAHAPADHIGVHDGRESVDSVWIRPVDALEDAEAGRRTIIFPTRMNLELLGRETGLEKTIKATLARSIVTVEPQMGETDGVKVLRIPEEAGYSLSEIPLDQVS